MSYVSTANKTNPAAALGALGVPGAFGLLLIVGLTVTVVAPPPDTGLDGYQVTPVHVDPIVEPDVKPDVTEITDPVSRQQVVAPPPRPDAPITFTQSATSPINELPVIIDDFGIGTDPVDFGDIGPSGPPAIDPIAATPRGNASGWITNNDYRSSWINREYSGVARFTLSVNTRGRVSDCSITSSTGHSVLDTATCRLLERRARFNPAEDSNGNAVMGTFSSSVSWQIPE